MTFCGIQRGVGLRKTATIIKLKNETMGLVIVEKIHEKPDVDIGVFGSSILL